MNRRRLVPKNICDLSRRGRTGIPEVVLAMYKDDEMLLDAVTQVLGEEQNVLVTKCSKRQLKLLGRRFGRRLRVADDASGIAVVSEKKEWKGASMGRVAVFAAGSSDLFVAEEASLSAEFFGLRVLRFYDCGVAGLHRLEKPLRDINADHVDAVIVVAGMEGALPSVIGGLVDAPLIAVPTSVGYGTGANGISALLTMLNSCSPGTAVVNIDNGFGAAAFAYKLVNSCKSKVRCKPFSMQY